MDRSGAVHRRAPPVPEHRRRNVLPLRAARRPGVRRSRGEHHLQAAVQRGRRDDGRAGRRGRADRRTADAQADGRRRQAHHRVRRRTAQAPQARTGQGHGRVASRPPRRGPAGVARGRGRDGADLRPALRRRRTQAAQARHAPHPHHPGAHQRGGVRRLRRLRREVQLPLGTAGGHRVRPQDADRPDVLQYRLQLSGRGLPLLRHCRGEAGPQPEGREPRENSRAAGIARTPTATAHHDAQRVLRRYRRHWHRHRQPGARDRSVARRLRRREPRPDRVESEGRTRGVAPAVRVGQARPVQPAQPRERRLLRGLRPAGRGRRQEPRLRRPGENSVGGVDQQDGDRGHGVRQVDRLSGDGLPPQPHRSGVAQRSLVRRTRGRRATVRWHRRSELPVGWRGVSDWGAAASGRRHRRSDCAQRRRRRCQRRSVPLGPHRHRRPRPLRRRRRRPSRSEAAVAVARAPPRRHDAVRTGGGPGGPSGRAARRLPERARRTTVRVGAAIDLDRRTCGGRSHRIQRGRRTGALQVHRVQGRIRGGAAADRPAVHGVRAVRASGGHRSDVPAAPPDAACDGTVQEDRARSAQPLRAAPARPGKAPAGHEVRPLRVHARPSGRARPARRVHRHRDAARRRPVGG